MLSTHFQNLSDNYIFPKIQQHVSQLQKQHPTAHILRLGIGDVSQPLAPCIIDAIKKAAEEMGTPEGFHGYGPEQGYAFLREKIAACDYANEGIESDEIFVSDGSKCDSANLQELFHPHAIVGVTDPTYPVYVDANVMAGRKILYFPCSEKDNFVSSPPKEHCDVIYLCSPNNPTGNALTLEQLAIWVDYAIKHQSIILYDAAYAAFIRSSNVARSIYQIPDAKKVAIEYRSFSKTAGFTGLRCAYTVIPKNLMGSMQNKHVALHSLWLRRQTTKFNGVSYPIQRAAEATYSELGKRQIHIQIDYYMQNAALLRSALEQMHFCCYGGIDAPFIWWKVPNQMNSWQFFTLLLEKLHIVVTPGLGFGSCGEGFVRLSSFAQRETIVQAIERLKNLPQSI